MVTIFGHSCGHIAWFYLYFRCAGCVCEISLGCSFGCPGFPAGRLAILVTGFFTNILLAAGLAYLGDLLGLDLYLAAVIAFGLRIFSNLGAIRRHFIFQQRRKKAQKQAVPEPNPDIVLHQAEVHASTGDILQEDLYQMPQEEQKEQENPEETEQ